VRTNQRREVESHPPAQHENTEALQQQSEETATAWTGRAPTRRDSQPAAHKIRQQLDGTDFSAAVYDVFVAQATGRQRRYPRAGPGMGIDL